MVNPQLGSFFADEIAALAVVRPPSQQLLPLTVPPSLSQLVTDGMKRLVCMAIHLWEA